MTTAVAFIDRRVANYLQIAAAFDPSVEVVFLDADEDGVLQITDWLEGRSGVEALHIISHGAEANLLLGSSELSAATLASYAGLLSRIGSALSTEADILLYGCNVASGPEGQAFVEQLAKLTGADVSASDDPTGAAFLGGDADLEVTFGDVAAKALINQALFDDLGVLLVDVGNTTTTAGSISVNTSKSDSIEISGDIDWFGITLSKGATYQFNLAGSATGAGTLPDPFLRLRDVSGNSILSKDDFGGTLNSQITYYAPSTATYYLSVGSAVPGGIGTYSLTASSLSTDWTRFVNIPDTLNVGLSDANNSQMQILLGTPNIEAGTPSAQVSGLLETRDVDPTSSDVTVTGIRPALDSLQQVFGAINADMPSFMSHVNTDGMLNVRVVSGTSTISNHSWGIAVDLFIDATRDIQFDNYAEAGLAALIPYFQAAGWVTGAGWVSIGREDSMHFEVSLETLQLWQTQGLLQPTQQLPNLDIRNDGNYTDAGGVVRAAAATLDVGTVAQGDNVTMTYRMSNFGLGNAPSSTTGIYRSNDAVFDANDIPLTVDTVAALGANVGSTETVTFSTSSIAPGSYFILAIADHTDAIQETTNVDNPSNAVALTVTAPSVTTVSISNAATVDEGGQLQFLVTRSGGTMSQPLTLSYSAIGGTATNGSDYTSPTGTVTFLANASTATISINTTANDGDDAIDFETVNIAFNPTTGVSFSSSTATGTIHDTHVAPATVSISNAATVDEGGQLQFLVTRSGGTISQPLTVFYSTGGQATSGSDYTAPPGSVTFAANSTTATIPIQTINDGVDEPIDNESLTVTLSGSPNYNLGASTATGTIHDINTPPPSTPEIALSFSGTNVADNDTTPSSAEGTDFGLVTQGATVDRTFTVTNNGTGTLTTSGLTPPAGFTVVEPLLSSIPSGGSDTFTVRLNTSSTGTKQGQITFNTNDSDENPYNFSVSGTVGEVATAGSVSIADAQIAEGDFGTKILTFTVTRAGGTAAFNVSYATANDSATADSDYSINSGLLQFLANENAKTISITINGDTSPEGHETFFVNLSNATNGALITDSQAVGTIINDDAAGDDFADSFTDTTAPFGLISTGGSATGNLEGTGDHDWFRVTLAAGIAVTIDLQGAPTSAGTLSDPYLYLYNSAGQLLAQDDDAGEGFNSQLIYTPGTSGTYYLDAAAFADAGTGNYTLGVTTLGLFTEGPDTVLLTQPGGTWHALGGNDVVTGTSGVDIIFGDAGDDTLDGGAGADMLHGGGGNDTYIVDDAGDQVIEQVSSGTDSVQTALATYFLGTNVENVTFLSNVAHVGFGNSLNNVVTGSGGGDTVFGNAGDDTLIGADGNDVLVGGLGADSFQGDGGDDIIEADSTDTAINGGLGFDSVSFTDGLSVNFNMGAASVEQVFSGPGNDVFDASTQTASVGIYSHLGNDVLIGGSGNDIMFALDGNDSLTGNNGNDALIGGAGIDTFSGGAGNDVLEADSSDVIQGGADFDFLYITDTAGVTLDMAATGVEWVLVAGGNSTINGSGKTGPIEIYTGGGNDILTGGTSVDGLSGGSGNDSIDGGANNDLLIGGAGADRLIGGAAFDTLVAGAADGAQDTFVFNTTSQGAFDFAYDFENGIDKFEISGVTGLTSFADLQIVNGGGSAEIYTASGNQLMFVVVGAAGQIDAGDFVFF